MKRSIEFSQKHRANTASDGLKSGRDLWPGWVDALRKYQMDGLVGWLLDTGRPFCFLSAQFMYMLSPFAGTRLVQVGQMLESDEDSQAFAQLLATAGQGDARSGQEEST